MELRLVRAGEADRSALRPTSAEQGAFVRDALVVARMVDRETRRRVWAEADAELRRLRAEAARYRRLLELAGAPS